MDYRIIGVHLFSPFFFSLYHISHHSERISLSGIFDAGMSVFTLGVAT